MDGTPRGLPPPRPVATATPEPKKGSKPPLIIGALAAAAVIAGLVFAFSNQTKPTETPNIPGQTSSSGVNIGSKPAYETLYRRTSPPPPAKK